MGAAIERLVVGTLMLLCLGLAGSATVAWADTTTTVTFEEPRIPGTASPQAGESVTTQYRSEGVEFSASTGPVTKPLGWSPYLNAVPDLYRDDANAPAGDSDHQVLYSYVCYSEGCSFNDYAAEMFARLRVETTKVELEAGTAGGGPVELAGYNIKGEAVAHQVKEVNTKVDTPLTIESTAKNIAYFSVARLNGGKDGYSALEVGNLSFVVPAVPPPPAILLEGNALPNGPVGSQGGTTQWTVDVERFNNANKAVKLEVTGLPSGVTVTGGTEIAPEADSTELTFSISPSAPLVSEAPFTIRATSAGVSEPSEIEEDFYIEAPLQVKLLNYSTGTSSSSATTQLTPCGAAVEEVQVTPGPGVTTPTALTLSASGDTSGLSYSLAKSSLPYPGGTVELPLSESASSGPGEAEITITGTNAGHPSVSATLHVQRGTGAITSVTPLGTGPVFALPLAPLYLSGGTQVKVSGSGLCPGSTVEFGNERAIATPSSYGPAGESLTATVPLYATSGAVTVLTPAFEELVAPHKLAVDNFRDTWGWPFVNYSLKESSVNYEVASTLFGYESVYVSTPFGNVPSPAAIVWDVEAESMVGNGVCFGMATLVQWLSSLSTYSLFEELGHYPSTAFTPHGLTGPSGPSAALEKTIAIFHLDQLSGQFESYQGEEMNEGNPISPQRTVEAVRAALKSGDGSELPVVDLQNQGPEGGGHAVVAYSVEGDGSGGFYIDVYNPNTPYTPAEEADPTGVTHRNEVENSRIHVNANGSWTFGDGFSPTWEGNAYHLYPAPWGTVPNPFAASPDERPELSFRKPLGGEPGWGATRRDGRLGLGGPGSSGWSTRAGNASAQTLDAVKFLGAIESANAKHARPALPSLSKQLGIVSSGPAGSLAQVRDAAGHTLINPNGSENVTPKTRIPHAALIFPATGGAKPGPPTALLPAGGTYTITERGSGRSYTDTLMGGGLDALVRSRAGAGVDDRIGVAQGAGRVSFAAGAAAQPVTIALTSDPAHGWRSVTLTTTSAHSATDSLSFRGGAVRYSHSGPASTVTLEFSSVTPGGLPVAASTGPIHVGAGQNATFTPTSWSALNTIAATVAGRGARRTMQLHNVLRLPKPVRSLALSVKRGLARARVLTIKAKLGRLPRGAQLQLVWSVQRGKHVLERHLLTLSGRQLNPGSHAESFTYTAPADGRYRFTGRATLFVTHGLIEQGRSIARSVGLTVR